MIVVITIEQIFLIYLRAGCKTISINCSGLKLISNSELIFIVNLLRINLREAFIYTQFSLRNALL